MAKTRVFISFDYDYDESLKVLLVGQAKNEDSPFSLADWSIKEHIDEDWKKKARTRIKAVDVVCVVCGEHTDIVTGVSAELKIAQLRLAGSHRHGVPPGLARGGCLELLGARRGSVRGGRLSAAAADARNRPDHAARPAA